MRILPRIQLLRQLLDRARDETQSADHSQRGNAVPNGKGQRCWPLASLVPEMDLIQGNVPGAHCKNSKNRDPKDPKPRCCNDGKNNRCDGQFV